MMNTEVHSNQNTTFERPHKPKSEGMVLDGLANMPKEAMLDEPGLAKTLQVSSRTIRRMVVRDELPPPIPLGGRSMWLVGRVLAHFDAAAERLTQEARARQRRLRSYVP